MQSMAKNKPKSNATDTVGKDSSADIWRLFTKIDGSLREPFDEYMKSLEYPTDQSRIIEKAFKEFLEKRGFWPPKKRATS